MHMHAVHAQAEHRYHATLYLQRHTTDEHDDGEEVRRAVRRAHREYARSVRREYAELKHRTTLESYLELYEFRASWFCLVEQFAMKAVLGAPALRRRRPAHTHTDSIPRAAGGRPGPAAGADAAAVRAWQSAFPPCSCRPARGGSSWRAPSSPRC